MPAWRFSTRRAAWKDVADLCEQFFGFQRFGATDTTKTINTTKKGNMSEQKKKKVNVRDLKPTKDAKGGFYGGGKPPVQRN